MSTRPHAGESPVQTPETSHTPRAGGRLLQAFDANKRQEDAGHGGDPLHISSQKDLGSKIIAMAADLNTNTGATHWHAISDLSNAQMHLAAKFGRTRLTDSLGSLQISHIKMTNSHKSLHESHCCFHMSLF